MAYEGQQIGISEHGILDDLLDLTASSLGAVEQMVKSAVQSVRDQVCTEGRVSAVLVEQNQTSAHGLALQSVAARPLRRS